MLTGPEVAFKDEVRASAQAVASEREHGGETGIAQAA